uniref:Cytochrome b6-f complex subunit 6 n=1 Tax=Chloroparvula japonica TaxID=1411623 RepID=A0A4D6C370_9CHLO|nr:subunit VI of cytochrome b6/f complex [Chloroparvula japonica]QBX98114.1 subunit VI of cytochrome b6/f complex [Chloroparvula japonica]
MLTIAGYIGFLVLSLGMSLALYLGLTKIELM